MHVLKPDHSRTANHRECPLGINRRCTRGDHAFVSHVGHGRVASCSARGAHWVRRPESLRQSSVRELLECDSGGRCGAADKEAFTFLATESALACATAADCVKRFASPPHWHYSPAWRPHLRHTPCALLPALPRVPVSHAAVATPEWVDGGFGPLRGRLERQLEPSACSGRLMAQREGGETALKFFRRVLRFAPIRAGLGAAPNPRAQPPHPPASGTPGPKHAEYSSIKAPQAGSAPSSATRTTVRGRSASVPAPFLHTPTSTEAKVRWPRPVGEPIAVRMWHGCPAAI